MLPPLIDPRRTVADDPVQECFFKSDVVTRFFALQPFVAEDFFTFGGKFFEKQRVFEELIFLLGRSVHHITDLKLFSPARLCLTCTANLRSQCRSGVLISGF